MLNTFFAPPFIQNFKWRDMDDSLNTHEERYGLTPEERANRLESTQLSQIFFKSFVYKFHPGILKELSETDFETLQKTRKDSKNKSNTYHEKREKKEKRTNRGILDHSI